MNFDNINIARTKFLEAVEAQAKALEELGEKKLDVAIAKREGKDQIAQDLEAKVTRFTTDVWYPAYKAERDAAIALCQAIAVDPELLKGRL